MFLCLCLVEVCFLLWVLMCSRLGNDKLFVTVNFYFRDQQDTVVTYKRKRKRNATNEEESFFEIDVNLPSQLFCFILDFLQNKFKTFLLGDFLTPNYNSILFLW